MNKSIYIPFYERIISDFGIKIGSVIATGGFGKVCHLELLEKYTSNDSLINLKELGGQVMKIPKDPEIKYLLREAGLQSSANHPFMMELTAFIPFTTNKSTNRTKGSFIILLPYASCGDLENLSLKTQFTKSTKTQIYKAIYSVCRSIWFLHKLSIFHRDIKSANVLIMEDGTPKLSDFGFAKIKEDNGMNSIAIRTPSFAAPETYHRQSSYPSDVFSLGLVLYEILEGSSVTEFYVSLHGQQKQEGYRNDSIRPRFSKRTPEIWQKLIQSMWCSDPLNRITMDDVMNEIEKKEYFDVGLKRKSKYRQEKGLDVIDSNDIENFIKEVKQKEIDNYYTKMNDTIRYLIEYENDNDSLEVKKPFFMPFDFSPFIKSIEDYEQSVSPFTQDQDDQSDIKIRYNLYSYSFNVLIHDFESCSRINEVNSKISLALYCMINNNDYSSAIELLNTNEQKKTGMVANIEYLMDLEGQQSSFVKGMIFEGRGKYQEAIDAYFDCLDEGQITKELLGRFGRLLLFLGESPEVKTEGRRLMDQAAQLGDSFSAFHIGVYDYVKAKGEEDPKLRREYLNDAIMHFDMAKFFPDVEMMVYLTYKLIGNKIKTLNAYRTMSQIYKSE